MKLNGIIYCLLMLLSVESFSQTDGFASGFLKFNSINGEVNLKGMHNNRKDTYVGYTEHQEANYYSGGIRLNTNGFLWHPKFMLFHIGGEYSPESNRDNYLVSPDRSEMRTLKAFNFGTTILSDKPITLSANYNLSSSYSNRENLNNIKTNSSSLSGSLNLRTKFLPISLNYYNNKSEQIEVQTDRTFNTEQNNIRVSAEKSFFSSDYNIFNYSHNDIYRQDRSLNSAHSITDNIRLNSSLFFDKEERYVFRSIIFSMNRKGDQKFHTFNATESLTLDLPSNLKFMGSYVLTRQQQEFQNSNHNKVFTRLNHKLFQSFNTSIFYNYMRSQHTSYNLINNSTGFSISYTKKIPTGSLNLSYGYSITRSNNKSESVYLEITNERYILTDGEITTLYKPYINVATILVKDISGGIIYQRDFDYILIEKGAYTEIQRIPGGQIANNSAVYIDYMAVQEGSYKYDVIAKNLSGNIVLFKRFLEFYYYGYYTDYNNVVKSDLLVVNYLNLNTLGGKFNFWDTELGAEYEDHNSTITPYKMLRYYLIFQKHIRKVVLSLNGNYRAYNMTDEKINREYSDLSGKAIYEFSQRTKLDLLVSYRFQRGPGIYLDQFTVNNELKTSYRKLFLKLGAGFYMRKREGYSTNFNSVYLEIARRF